MRLLSQMTVPDFGVAYEKCATCPIRHRAVCSTSTPAELAELDEIKFYRDFEPGQEIVSEGEHTQFLGSVVRGVLVLQKTLEDGRRQIVGLLFASDFVGRPLRPEAPYDVIAISPVRMCLFHRPQFETLLRHNSHLEHRLLEMTLDELDAAREWMVLLGRKTATEKVASLLLILALRIAALEKIEPHSGMTFEIPLTREAIGEFLGLTIETVSRQFSALSRAGVIGIENARTISIADLHELGRRAGHWSEDLRWSLDRYGTDSKVS